jgi:DNA-directed RNA polymerase subunit alpha
VVEVWTDGTITPEMALVEAAKIHRKHLNPFVHYFEAGKELQKSVTIEVAEPEEEASRNIREMLDRPITELDLSVRAANCMEVEGIETIGQLCARTETEMLGVRNFGKTSLREIRKKLDERGLELGMEEARSLAASKEG